MFLVYFLFPFALLAVKTDLTVLIFFTVEFAGSNKFHMMLSHYISMTILSVPISEYAKGYPGKKTLFCSLAKGPISILLLLKKTTA